nr:hypothetical protein CFP56_20870 [Quercus suber]
MSTLPLNANTSMNATDRSVCKWMIGSMTNIQKNPTSHLTSLTNVVMRRDPAFMLWREMLGSGNSSGVTSHAGTSFRTVLASMVNSSEAYNCNCNDIETVPTVKLCKDACHQLAIRRFFDTLVLKAPW